MEPEQKQRKQLKDLPQFLVREICQDVPAVGEVELRGTLENADGIQSGECWLIWPDADGRYGRLAVAGDAQADSVFTPNDELPPTAPGTRLAYLRDRWKPYHLWFAFSPASIWKHQEFDPADAEAEPYGEPASALEKDIQTNRGICLKKQGSQTGRSRYYPEPAGGFPPDSPFYGYPKVVKAGWDHEHCEYCWNHIDSQNMGHVNPDDDWVCESCFQKYVATHNLAFIDEL